MFVYRKSRIKVRIVNKSARKFQTEQHHRREPTDRLGRPSPPTRRDARRAALKKKKNLAKPNKYTRAKKEKKRGAEHTHNIRQNALLPSFS